MTAVLQAVVVNFWPGFPSPNEWTRAYQALAVVGRGSLDVGPEVERFGAMEDLAAGDGRLFPNKAPGLLPLLLPGALVARTLVGDHGAAELGVTLVLGRLLASSLPFLVSLLLLARLTAGEPRGGPLAVAAYALATPMLAASLLLFSHALSACLLLAAYALLHRNGPPARSCLLAGVLLGWAVAAEYPVAVPAAVIGATAMPRLGWRRAAFAGLGGGVPLALLAAYNLACFGSPWVLSSGREANPAYASLAHSGLFGIGLPGLGSLHTLLLSPSRGLLVWAPLLALAAAGGLRRPARTEPVTTRLALAGAPLTLLLLLAGYPNAHGGWFPGPRYLLPVVPLLALLAARGAEAVLKHAVGRVAVTVAAFWAVVLTWLSVASFPYLPPDYPLPAFSFSGRLLAGGVQARSWLPAAAVTLLLLVLAVAAAWELARLASGRCFETVVAALLVTAPLVVAAALPPPVSFTARLEWAVVLDVYAGAPPGGALESLRDRCLDPNERARVERWIARRERLVR